MPVVKNYHCPNCGAALPLQRASTGTCEYCNTAYTIEGMQHYQGMLTNEPIKSGVTFCAQPLQVHTMLVNYLLSDVSAPLDFAEKAEITGIRPLCLPAYYFHCNGTSDYLCDVANESTREVSASGNTEVVTGKSWATINGSTHAEAEGIVSGNPEYDNLINSMYNPFESGCLTDPESLEIPANIETVRYSRPATDILSQFARPFLTQKLQESAARQLGNRECRNLTLGSINISQDQGVDKVLAGAYEITCQYGDTVRKVYVSPDGRRMVAAEGPLVDSTRAELMRTMDAQLKNLTGNHKLFMIAAIAGISVAVLFHKSILLLIAGILAGGVGIWQLVTIKPKKDALEAQLRTIREGSEKKRAELLQSGKMLKGFSEHWK